MRTGFVGHGAMGMHMARNLQRAGLLAAVWNRSSSKAQALAAELEVDAPATLAELAGACEAIVSCVSADADVLEVARALAPAVPQGALMLDCSTVSAETARQAAGILAARGAEFLDCPVSGGVEGARDGTLAIMVGGKPEAFERAQPILQALGRTIAHFGPVGAGEAAKATNQIMVAGIIDAIAEAMAFAHAEGLPLEKLIDTLGKGAGSSWYFVHRAPNMAARFGTALPVVERMRAEYAELIARGYGDEDISATFRLKEELFERTNIMRAPNRGNA